MTNGRCRTPDLTPRNRRVYTVSGQYDQQHHEHHDEPCQQAGYRAPSSSHFFIASSPTNNESDSLQEIGDGSSILAACCAHAPAPARAHGAPRHVDQRYRDAVTHAHRTVAIRVVAPMDLICTWVALAAPCSTTRRYCSNKGSHPSSPASSTRRRLPYRSSAIAAQNAAGDRCWRRSRRSPRCASSAVAHGSQCHESRLCKVKSCAAQKLRLRRYKDHPPKPGGAFRRLRRARHDEAPARLSENRMGEELPLGARCSP